MAEKIIQRIDGILKHIDYVQKEINNVSFEDFSNGHLLPEAICFSIAQIGERLNKLEELLSERYPHLPWKEARKMRNIIVHDYDEVNFEEVYITATKDLPVLKKELLNIKDDICEISKNALFTKRLMIRRWDDFDACELFELAKDQEIGYWCGFFPHKHIRDSFFALHNFLEDEETYAICLKENRFVIGSISLSTGTDLAKNKNERELGYWIGKQYWGNGYATEAVEAVISYIFNNMDVSIIWCGRFEGNEKSKRVQEKLGFTYSYTNKNYYVAQTNQKRICHISYLLKENWKKQNGSK